MGCDGVWAAKARTRLGPEGDGIWTAQARRPLDREGAKTHEDHEGARRNQTMLTAGTASSSSNNAEV